MTYEWRYINKQALPSGVSYTLIIDSVGIDGETSTIRIEKTFKVSEKTIDEEFLRQRAKHEISRIMDELTNPFVLPNDMPEQEAMIDDGSAS